MGPGRDDLGLGDREEIGISGGLNGHDSNAEETSSGGSKGDVGSSVKVDGGLGEHGVVLELRAAEGRAVTTDDDQLGCEDSMVRAGLSDSFAGARYRPSSGPEATEPKVQTHSVRNAWP